MTKKVHKPVRANQDADDNEQLAKREAKHKLRQLSPVAKTEVINEVVAKQFSGFTNFLRDQSVVGIAIGLVLGTQVKQVVDQMVSGFINPFLGLILPGNGALSDKVFNVHLFGKVATFGWGALANTLLNFVAVATLVYVIFRTLQLDKLAKKK